jgi:hypothetical protein
VVETCARTAASRGSEAMVMRFDACGMTVVCALALAADKTAKMAINL